MSENSTPVESSQAYQIKEKLAELEAALLEATPTMPGILREIHGQLKKDDSLVSILSDDECAILVNGLKAQTSTIIAASALKKGVGKKKAQKKITVDDL